MKQPHILNLGMKSDLYSQIFHYTEVSSTNNVAMALAEEGVEEGTVIVADAQSEGRGRAGKTWASPVGGLWLSIVLRPKIEPIEAHQLTFVASLAVTTAIGHFGPLQPRIKWPNDILLTNKKVGGILIDLGSHGKKIDYLIIGIGLNLTVDPHHFSPEVSTIATSIATNLPPGTRISHDAFLQNLLREFEVYYQLWKQRGFSYIVSKWKRLSDIVGCEVRVEDPPNDPMEGEVVDIDTTGALLIKTEENTVRKIRSGTITIKERGIWPFPIKVPKLPLP